MTQDRARFAQAVAKTGPLFIEPVEHLVDDRRIDVESARQAGEEGRDNYVRAPELLSHIDDSIVPPGRGAQAGVLGALALAARRVAASSRP